MQLNVYYIMLEKLQSFADGKYDLERRDIEDIYLEQRGDAAEQLDELHITQRTASTGESFPRVKMADPSAKILQQARANGGVSRTASHSSKVDLDRKSSYSKGGLDRKVSSGSYAGRSPEPAAPPPYSPSSGASVVGKKAPPPPPPLKPKPGAAPKQYCTAIFDYEAQVSRDIRRH